MEADYGPVELLESSLKSFTCRRQLSMLRCANNETTYGGKKKKKKRWHIIIKENDDYPETKDKVTEYCDLTENLK